MKRLIGIIIIIIFSIFFTRTVKADNYGGGEVTPSVIFIDKKVAYPYSKNKKADKIICDDRYEYQDNYFASDINQRFNPGDYVCFKIKVKNQSEEELRYIRINDYLPLYMSFIDGPGKFNNEENMFTFTVDSLKPNEAKNFHFKMKIDKEDQLPIDKGLFCGQDGFINRTEAIVGNYSSQDTSQFCVERHVVNKGLIPNTGPELGLLLFGFEIASIGLGIRLIKKHE